MYLFDKKEEEIKIEKGYGQTIKALIMLTRGGWHKGKKRKRHKSLISEGLARRVLEAKGPG